MIGYDVRDTLRVQLRSSRATAERARELLAHTRARLAARARAAPHIRAEKARPLARLTYGNEPLGHAGLAAFPRCGHWWTYPTPATAEQMHEVARFNLGITCSFCLAAYHDATHARACGILARLN